MSNLAKIETDRILLGPISSVVFEKKIRALCRVPYHNHPNGCPNFGKRIDCPPKAKFFGDLFSESDAYILAIRFDFAGYVAMRKQEHPKWSEVMLRNPLYWQGYVRKLLKEFISEKERGFKEKGYSLVANPEAMGVNITKTCENAGLILEWPPKNHVIKLVLFAKNKES